jgi:CMP-N-acetylneuraminic acid synthetase
MILGIIPARGGSKGIPRKNIRPLAGYPLLYYTVETAFRSGVIDRLILSTDCEEIAELAHELGVEVPFIRPLELAQDDTPMLPVLQHAVRKIEEDGWHAEIVVLLQPTAPLRQPKHIISAISLLRSTGCDSVVSVVEIPKHYSPYYAMKIAEGRLMSFLPEGRVIARRQDVPPVYSRDGTVYVMWREVLMGQDSLYGSDCRPLVLPSEESINLDTLDDWIVAETRLAAQRQQQVDMTSQ